MQSKTVWVGLVGLRPRVGNDVLGDARGAYVRILALATDEKDYLQQMYATLAEFEFDFDEACDVEPVADLARREGIDAELAEIAEKVAADGASRFGEFFVYEEDDS